MLGVMITINYTFETPLKINIEYIIIKNENVRLRHKYKITIITLYLVEKTASSCCTVYFSKYSGYTWYTIQCLICHVIQLNNDVILSSIQMYTCTS